MPDCATLAGVSHPVRPGARPRFNEDAAAYDRTRPAAPAAVIDEVLELAGIAAGAVVVEIGPGTGQATRPLAERGLRVLALEPGTRLAALTRANLAGFPEVEVRSTSFESWDRAGQAVDAVIAVNSFHWLDARARFGRVAAALRPGGSLVVLDTPVVVPGGADRFWTEVQDDWAAAGVDRVDPVTKRPERVGDWAGAIRASGRFAERQVLRRRFDVELTAEQYSVNLSTQTPVAELPPQVRAQLLDRVRRRVQRGGGRLVVHHLAVATVATRLP